MREHIPPDHLQSLPEKCVGTPLIRLVMQTHIARDDKPPIWLPDTYNADLRYPDFRQALPTWTEPEQQAVDQAAADVRTRAQALLKNDPATVEQASSVREEFALGPHQPPPASILAQPDIIHELATAAMPDIVHALSWYVHALQRLQCTLRERVLEFMPLIRKDTFELEQTSDLPPGMADTLEDAITGIRAVHIMDAFEAGELGHRGYYYADEGDMGVAASYLHEAYEIVVHEGLHATADRNKRGFMSITKENEELIWLDEATVEHIAQVITWGRPSVVAPSNRPRPGAYRFERQLLATMLHRSGTTPRKLVFAWSEPRTGDLRHRRQLTKTFERHFDNLVPDDSGTFVEAVAADYNAAQTTDQHQQVMEEWQARIRRPRPPRRHT